MNASLNYFCGNCHCSKSVCVFFTAELKGNCAKAFFFTRFTSQYEALPSTINNTGTRVIRKLNLANKFLAFHLLPFLQWWKIYFFLSSRTTPKSSLLLLLASVYASLFSFALSPRLSHPRFFFVLLAGALFEMMLYARQTREILASKRSEKEKVFFSLSVFAWKVGKISHWGLQCWGGGRSRAHTEKALKSIFARISRIHFEAQYWNWSLATSSMQALRTRR